MYINNVETCNFISVILIPVSWKRFFFHSKKLFWQE